MAMGKLLSCVAVTVAVTHFATPVYADYVPPSTDFSEFVKQFDLPTDTTDSDYTIDAVLGVLYGAVDITSEYVDRVTDKIIDVVDRTETTLFDWVYVVDNTFHLTPYGESLAEVVLSSVYGGDGAIGKGWYPCSDGDFVRVLGGDDYPIEVQHSLYSDPVYYAYVGGSSVTDICFAFKHDFDSSPLNGTFKYMYLDDFTTRDFSGIVQPYPSGSASPILGMYDTSPIYSAIFRAKFYGFYYTSVDTALDDFFSSVPTSDVPYRDVPSFPSPRDIVYNRLPASGVYDGSVLYYPTYSDVYYPSIAVDDIVLPSYESDLDYDVSVPIVDRVGLNMAFDYIPIEYIGLAVLVLGFLVLGVLL